MIIFGNDILNISTGIGKITPFPSAQLVIVVIKGELSFGSQLFADTCSEVKPPPFGLSTSDAFTPKYVEVSVPVYFGIHRNCFYKLHSSPLRSDHVR